MNFSWVLMASISLCLLACEDSSQKSMTPTAKKDQSDADAKSIVDLDEESEESSERKVSKVKSKSKKSKDEIYQTPVEDLADIPDAAVDPMGVQKPDLGDSIDLASGPEDTKAEAQPVKKTGTLVEGQWHLTFKHLNLGQIGLEEEAMDYGIAKALNSVSQVKEVIPVYPLEGGLSYSVDPNDFGFSSAQISTIEGCGHLRYTDMEGRRWMEADSLMYCILEPRIYYQLMGIAGSSDIESLTEAKYMQTERSKDNHTMFCVEDSDVANGNKRMLERIVRPDGGTYWGTGDYLSPAAIEAAIERGTFPAGSRGANLKAGEFMWEMPNGFIGFALSGFVSQARLEANTDVASDQGRDDTYVIAGFGCMACHTNGFNAGNYIPCGTGSPTARYPNEQEFFQIIADDNKRFYNTVKKLGISDETIAGPEPVTAIIVNFEKVTNTRFNAGGAAGGLVGGVGAGVGGGVGNVGGAGGVLDNVGGLGGLGAP